MFILFLESNSALTGKGVHCIISSNLMSGMSRKVEGKSGRPLCPGSCFTFENKSASSSQFCVPNVLLRMKSKSSRSSYILSAGSGLVLVADRVEPGLPIESKWETCGDMFDAGEGTLCDWGDETLCWGDSGEVPRGEETGEALRLSFKMLIMLVS